MAIIPELKVNSERNSKKQASSRPDDVTENGEAGKTKAALTVQERDFWRESPVTILDPLQPSGSCKGDASISVLLSRKKPEIRNLDTVQESDQSPLCSLTGYLLNALLNNHLTEQPSDPTKTFLYPPPPPPDLCYFLSNWGASSAFPRQVPLNNGLFDPWLVQEKSFSSGASKLRSFLASLWGKSK